MQQIFKIITPLSISIFLALLFHINGVMGMAGAEKDWFIAKTPVNLLCMFVLLIFTEGGRNKDFIKFLLLCFMVGLLTEMIGVNTGLLFGHYAYGEPLGIKLLGVPLLIGIQWFVSVYCSIHILNYATQMVGIPSLGIGVQAFITAFITTAFDYIIEPAAVKLGFWHWYGEEVPLYNYICWFIISFCLSFFYFKQFKDEKSINLFAVALFFIQISFFIYVSKYL